MWTGGVGTRRDDALERDLVRARLMKQLADRPRDVVLLASDESFLGETLEHPVGDLAGLLDRRQLPLVLDRSQAFDEPPPRHRLD